MGPTPEAKEAVANAMLSVVEAVTAAGGQGGGGELAAVALREAINEASWRDVLHLIAAPGFLVALLLYFFLPEPRDNNQRLLVGSSPSLPAAAPPSPSTSTHSPFSSLKGRSSMFATVASPSRALRSSSLSSSSSSPAYKVSSKESARTTGSLTSLTSSSSGYLGLLRNPAFLTTTLAAALNDVGSYALIAWQSSFYERVYHLDPAVYAPTLAAVLPIGGIIGGVGGGWAADRLAQAIPGGRAYVTAGASALAAPFLLWSLMADRQEESFLALLIGFSLSEAWRAPSAVMARSVAPASMGASASALYLCVRNLVGGLGPLFVALLSQQLGGDLRTALLLVPAAYLGSGAMFFLAEGIFTRQQLEKDRREEEETAIVGRQKIVARQWV